MELFGVPVDLQPLWLTLQVAGLTTAILLILSTLLAAWLAGMRSRAKVLIEAVVALPLVLPPTVLGFYLLIALNPNGVLTQALRTLGYQGQLSFSFTGLVIGSVVYSLPFAVQPLLRAFEAVPRRLLDAAFTMRARRWDRFFHITLPLSKAGYLVAGTLTFAHTVGEFGVVLMLGGNIPGKTRVISIDIFDHVDNLEYAQAHVLSLFLLVFAVLVLTVLYALNRQWDRRHGG
ncbi:MAG: molybdate ABC transporter permease subunit [Thiomonas sp.]|nr:molybdate ABC transporter permease subunit [Thiomonas sp.]